ncbi:MAG: tetratricopeptide repeat protein [Phycisphaerae bacterium]
MSRLEQLKKLVASQPDDPMPHYGLGLEYINLERWDEAAQAFEAAIRVDAKYSAAYYHKARALISAGRHDDARATLEAGKIVARAAGDWHTDSEMQDLLDSLA